MNIFAISDLHLLGNDDKKMDIFGNHWRGHWDKIRRDWREKVRQEDLVLVPGDVSWAMKLEDAVQDLTEVDELPGRKILVKGNHDFWWSSVTKLRQVLPASITALFNDCVVLDSFVVCGTRGWTCPLDALSAADEKIYNREVGRLAASLRCAKSVAPDKPILAMMHYPPFNERREESGFTRLLSEYGVLRTVYGHLHGPSLKNVFEGELRGVDYRLVSCDYLNFQLKEIYSV
ncbi:MAG: metallophosphoesterase [Christensenellales bacterium]|jgi:predicted phosphohydrolase